MANEVTVTTTYTFVSNDGTSYGKTHSYKSDANTEASRARRLAFKATTAGPTVLEFSSTPSYRAQLTGPCMLFLVNRDERMDMVITLASNAGNFSQRRLKAGEWLFLDITDSDQSAYADPLVYAPDSMLTVVAQSENSDALGEYLCIYKSTS